MGLEDWEHFRA